MRYVARTYTIIVAACALISAEAEARRDWVDFGQLNWGVDIEFRGTSSDGSLRHFSFEEQLSFSNKGYLISPRLAEFSIGLKPTFYQARSADGSQAGRADGTSLDYDIGLTLLDGLKLPYSFAASASRGRGTQSSGSGGQSDFVLTNRSVLMRWELPAFPMTLNYDDQSSRRTASFGDERAFTTRDSFQRRLSWRAESSKLRMRVDKRWHDDRAGNNDFDTLTQDLTHKLRWGKNSGLTTRQGYIRREGRNSSERFRFSEQLYIQHLNNLASGLRYNYQSTSQNGENKSYSGVYDLNYKPLENLGLSLSGLGQKSLTESGSQKAFGGSAGLNYSRAIFWNGRAQLNFMGSSLRSDRQFDDATLKFQDVPFTVPATLLVLLNETAINSESIFVIDVAAGQVFLEGVDYIVRTLPGDRTELQVLTSGLIVAGDKILVSYDAAAQPSAKFRTETFNANMSLDFNSLRFNHSTRIRSNSVQSGSLGEGQGDLLDQNTGVAWSWSSEWIETTANASFNTHKSGDFSTKDLTFTETARITFSESVRLGLSAGQSSYANDGRTAKSSRWGVNLGWTPMNRMLVTSYLNGSNYQDVEGRSEERLRAGINMTWQMRKFKVSSYLSHRSEGFQDSGTQTFGVRIGRRS